MIDAYAHLGSPRFWTLEDFLPTMRALGATRAMIASFDGCPDLAECHRARASDPDAFRIYGLALGRDRAEVEAGLTAQFAAGFDGARLTDKLIAEQPWILDLMSAEDAVPLVVGSGGLAAAAPALIGFLERRSGATVASPHFAGPADPDILSRPGPVRDLFSHPRFAVIASRHAMFAPALLDAWMRALIEMVGWDRLMWGSEAPVVFWRDEPLANTPLWIDRFAPTAFQRTAFHEGNAGRLIFARPTRPVKPLKLPFDPFALQAPPPAPMFPNGLPVDPALPARIVRAWMADGGEATGSLGAYMSRVIARGLDAARATAESTDSPR